MGKGQSNRQQYEVKKLYRTAIREKREMVYKRTPYGIGNPKMVVSSIPADEKAEIMANYFNEVVVPLATEYGLCSNDDEKEKLVGEWAQMNIRRMDDIDEQYVEYKMDFAAAIWILDINGRHGCPGLPFRYSLCGHTQGIGQVLDFNAGGCAQHLDILSCLRNIDCWNVHNIAAFLDSGNKKAACRNRQAA